MEYNANPSPKCTPIAFPYTTFVAKRLLVMGCWQ